MLSDHVKIVHTGFLKLVCVLVAVCKTIRRQHQHIWQTVGLFGASSIERLASERGMTAQAAAFKAIQK